MPPHLLFLGDSLIEYFDWQQRFPDYRTTNLGIAGETVEGLLARASLIKQQVDPPDWLLVMTGTNNIAMEDYGFMPAYGALVGCLQQAFPRADVVLNSLLPFTLPWVAASAIHRMNEKIAGLAREKGIRFLDAHQAFTAGAHTVSEYFLEDGVHLGPQGYAAWSKVIAPLLPPGG